MTYKDKDKQREANRKAKARQRAKGMTKGVTERSMTSIPTSHPVIPEYPRVSDQDFTRLLATLPPGSPNVRVSKPGDADYEPQCETTRAFVEGRPKRPKTEFNVGEVSRCSEMRDMKDTLAKPKRGLDIKCFEDLPPDVQETIAMMSRRDGKIDPIIKANRTAIAIRYQHLFPDRF